MILQVDDVLFAAHALRLRATGTSPELEVLALVHEALVERLRDLFRTPEILVIAAALAGEQRVYGMVEVITPNRVEPVPPLRARTHQHRIVCVRFGDGQHGAAKLLLERIDAFA